MQLAPAGNVAHLRISALLAKKGMHTQPLVAPSMHTQPLPDVLWTPLVVGLHVCTVLIFKKCVCQTNQKQVLLYVCAPQFSLTFRRAVMPGR